MNNECFASKFSSDYLSFQELKYNYNHFCKIVGIPESNKEEIIGNELMEKFGCQVELRSPPSRVIGIKKGRPDKFTTPSTFGLVKKPSSLKANFMSQFTAIDGVVPNSAIAVVHFVLILIVPLITPIVSYLALVQMTTLQGNVYQKPATYMEFFETNRMDPWWDRTPHVVLVN